MFPEPEWLATISAEGAASSASDSTKHHFEVTGSKTKTAGKAESPDKETTVSFRSPKNPGGAPKNITKNARKTPIRNKLFLFTTPPLNR